MEGWETTYCIYRLGQVNDESLRVFTRLFAHMHSKLDSLLSGFALGIVDL